MLPATCHSRLSCAATKDRYQRTDDRREKLKNDALYLTFIFCPLSSVILLGRYPDVVRYTQLNLLRRRNQV